MTELEYAAAMEQLFVNADANGNDKLEPEEMKAFTKSVMQAANIPIESINMVINEGKFDVWPLAEDFLKNDKYSKWEDFKAALPTLKNDILKGCPPKPKDDEI